MGLMKRFAMVAALLSVGAASCASTFPYRWFGLDAKNYEGTLLGPKPKDDLPFSTCEPDDVTKGNCVVMLVEEFHRMRAKYVELQQRLKSCEEQR
jgi:hypothetical protein